MTQAPRPLLPTLGVLLLAGAAILPGAQGLSHEGGLAFHFIDASADGCPLRSAGPPGASRAASSEGGLVACVDLPGALPGGVVRLGAASLDNPSCENDGSGTCTADADGTYTDAYIWYCSSSCNGLGPTDGRVELSTTGSACHEGMGGACYIGHCDFKAGVPVVCAGDHGSFRTVSADSLGGYTRQSNVYFGVELRRAA
jgi:hypothetical protein